MPPHLPDTGEVYVRALWLVVHLGLLVCVGADSKTVFLAKLVNSLDPQPHVIVIARINCFQGPHGQCFGHQYGSRVRGAVHS